MDILDIEKSYMEIRKKDVKYIPERVFVSTFLRYFAGLEQENSHKTAEWIAIAGNPFTPVEIKNQNGETIFTVPPLMSTKGIRADKDIQVSFGHIFATFQQYNRISPAKGMQYLHRALGDVHSGIKDANEIDDPLAGWLKIFKHYGLGGEVETNEPDQTKRKEKLPVDEVITFENL